MHILYSKKHQMNKDRGPLSSVIEVTRDYTLFSLDCMVRHLSLIVHVHYSSKFVLICPNLFLYAHMYIPCPHYKVLSFEAL